MTDLEQRLRDAFGPVAVPAGLVRSVDFWRLVAEGAQEAIVALPDPYRVVRKLEAAMFGYESDAPEDFQPEYRTLASFLDECHPEWRVTTRRPPSPARWREECLRQRSPDCYHEGSPTA